MLSQQLSISSLSWVITRMVPAVPRFAFQPFRDQAHILPVKAAGGLVEDQYPAAGKDGAGDGKPLLLSAGQGGRVRVPVLVKAKFFQQDLAWSLLSSVNSVFSSSSSATLAVKNCVDVSLPQ